MSSIAYTTISDVISKLTPNILNCINVLTNYGGTDWKDYLTSVNVSDNEYKKILIAKNDELDVYIIFWGKNATTKIHNHPLGGCIAKVLEGELMETSYLNQNENALRIKNSVLSKNSIVNRVGSMFLHKIENNNEFLSASIHVYFPSGFQHKTYDEVTIN